MTSSQSEKSAYQFLACSLEYVSHMLWTTYREGMGMGVGEKVKREETSVSLWLIHADVWQKPSQYYKIIILQLKKNKRIF